MEAVPPAGPAGLSAGDPLAGLTRWLAEGRVDEAAAERARRRWLERQADEDATLAGILLDLAERAEPVTVRTAGGAVLRGRLVALMADAAVLRGAPIGDVFVPFRRVATVRPAPGRAAASGWRSLAADVGLAAVVVELVADRPDVTVAAAGEEVRGRLTRAGRDLLTVVPEGVDRTPVHVAIAALDHLVVRR